MTEFEEWRVMLKSIWIPTLWWVQLSTQQRDRMLRGMYLAGYSPTDAAAVIEDVTDTTLKWCNQLCGASKREAGLKHNKN